MQAVPISKKSLETRKLKSEVVALELAGNLTICGVLPAPTTCHNLPAWQLVKSPVFFEKFDFDLVCLIGDRFELLSIVTVCILYRKPIVHIHGGELSYGSMDEQVRHMMTKASHLHFVSCREHARNVRKMGEEAWRIHITGALGIDNMAKMKVLDRSVIFKRLNLDADKPVALMTYHPETSDASSKDLAQVKAIFDVLDHATEQVVITSPNAEVGREKLVEYIHKRVAKRDAYHYFESLGTDLYQHLLCHASFVIGNSSSGIIEAPFFSVPTINIGSRQAGRTRHASIHDADFSKQSISDAISKVKTPGFKRRAKAAKFKFGDGKSAQRMVRILSMTKINQKLMYKTLDFPRS